MDNEHFEQVMNGAITAIAERRRQAREYIELLDEATSALVRVRDTEGKIGSW